MLTRRTLLLTLFGLLFAAETVGVDLVLVRGLSAKNIVLYLFLLGLTLETILDAKPKRIELLAVHLPFLGLIAYALITWIFFTIGNILELSYKPQGSDFGEFLTLARIKSFLIDRYAFFLAFFYGVTTIEDARWVMKRIIWIFIAGNVLTLIDAFNIPDLGIIHQRDDSRVSGPLGESNQYAAFSLLFLPTVAILAAVTRDAGRIGYAFGALVTFTVIVLTTSRGAMVGLALGLMGGLFFMRHHLGTGRIVKVIAGVTVTIGVAVTVAAIGFYDLLVERFVEHTGADDLKTVSSGRSENWTRLIEIQLKEPITFLFGYGWGMSMKLSDSATHNTYIEYLFDLGAIGLMMICGLFWSVVRTTRRGIDAVRGELQAELGAFLVGFLGLCVAIFFVNLFNPWWYIWAFCGLMMRLALEAGRTDTEAMSEAIPARLPRTLAEPPRPKWPPRPRRGAASGGVRTDR